MFRTKRFMSTIGVVFVFLGMMVIFQSDKAEADHSSWSCKFKSHYSFFLPPLLTYRFITSTTINTNCPVCDWSSETYPHEVSYSEENAHTQVQWIHWALFGYVNCHVHTGPGVPTGRILYMLTLCDNEPG